MFLIESGEISRFICEFNNDKNDINPIKKTIFAEIGINIFIFFKYKIKGTNINVNKSPNEKEPNNWVKGKYGANVEVDIKIKRKMFKKKLLFLY